MLKLFCSHHVCSFSDQSFVIHGEVVQHTLYAVIQPSGERKIYVTLLWFYYRYSGTQASTNMVILDIKMLSGFVPDPKSLENVSYWRKFHLHGKV